MRVPGGSLQILFFFLVMTGLLCVRLRARAAARVQDLEYAYIKPNRYYAVFGTESCFQVMVPDYAGLEFEFALLHGPMFSTTGYKTVMASQKRSAGSSFSYTPRDKGWYKLVATIHDPYSGSLTIQTGPFHCSNQAAGAELLSTRISSIMALMHREGCKSAYEKALFIHDWLIHNADYDESLKVYDPYTLLFSGVGVCQSYALAYQMLLRQAGIKSQYVTGYSRGQLHAWNLVHLDGEWTFIDPTWNDPVGGGKEGHDYFGMTDVQLARDHDWSTGKQKPPAATADTHNYLLKNGWMPFDNPEGLAALMTRELADKNPRIQYTYLGEDRYFDTMYEIKKFMEAQSHKHFVESYSYGGSAYAGAMEVTYGDFSDYIPFTDDEGFLAAMDGQLKAKAPVIKMYYQGDDRYFNYGSYLNRFLTDKAAEYGVKSYSYTYYPFHGVAELEYND